MIEELYGNYQEELVRWCGGMTGDMTVAEDLVQEAFMRAMLHEELLQSLREVQKRAWLYRCVKNLFVDWIRRGRRESASEYLPEPGVWDSAMEELEWSGLLNSLPDSEGELFVLRYLQDYNSTQLGQLYRMPPGTVRAKLSSARKHLRDALE